MNPERPAVLRRCVLIPIVLAVSLIGTPAGAQNLPTRGESLKHKPGTADPMKPAEALADQRIDKFRQATDPTSRRQAFLEMQGDPIAVQRLNNNHQDLVGPANRQLISIREPAKTGIRAEIAKKYNVPPDRIEFFEPGKTPQSDPGKFGQDWDLAVRIRDKSGNLRDVPYTVSQTVAHDAYYKSATMGEKVQIRVTNADGTLRNITPGEFAQRQSLAVTDHQHSDAYGGGKTEGAHMTDMARKGPTGKPMADPGATLRDPTQISQAVEFKSNEAAERAAHLAGEGKNPQGWRLEQIRQATKQYDKYVQPMTEAQGGRISPQTRKGIEILKEVSEGKITPAQADARLQQMGETVETVIRKSALNIEAAQVLKAPGAKGPVVGGDAFVESVRDRLANKGIDPEGERKLKDVKSGAPGPPNSDGTQPKNPNAGRSNGGENKPGGTTDGGSAAAEGKGRTSVGDGGNAPDGGTRGTAGTGDTGTLTERTKTTTGLPGGEKPRAGSLADAGKAPDGTGKTNVPSEAPEGGGLGSRAGKLVKGVFGGMAVLGAASMTAEGSTRTIDHKEKMDTIAGALKSIRDERTTLQQHLKSLGEAHNLGDAFDEEKGFNTADGRAAVEQLKGQVGPEKAAQIAETMKKLETLDRHQAGIETGRENLKDKWRREGLGDAVMSVIPFTSSTAVDATELDAIPELKRYVPSLVVKPSSQAPDVKAESPAEAKLLAALADPERRRKFREDRTDEQILNTFRASGSLDDVLAPPDSEKVAADAPPAPTQPPIPPPSPGDGQESTLMPVSFNVDDLAIVPEADQVAATELEGLEEIHPPPPVEEGDLPLPKDFTLSDGPTGSTAADFEAGRTGESESGNSSGPGEVNVAAIAAGTAGQTATDFDPNAFSRGQAIAEAKEGVKVAGDYAEATRLEMELRSAEDEYKRALEEAKRFKSERRAQAQIVAAQREALSRYQRYLSRKRAYQKYQAGHYYQSAPAQAQPHGHKPTRIIRDMP